MADRDQMRKVDMQKEFANLRDSEKYFIRKLESMNRERARDMMALRKRNLLTGFLLGAGVLGIYFYSMHAVRQERFLDDFDKIPEKAEHS